MGLKNGTRLGPYEILSMIGVGGMGEVYKARDTRLDRFVAVKVISERLADDSDALTRFEREAKSVAALSNPNILAIHDFGTVGGVAYAVMEFLEGQTLRELLAKGPLPIPRAREIALQISNGLAAAHEKGIIHRDLKPGNIFITKENVVKILDFGLAKLLPVSGPDGEHLSEIATEGAPTGTVVGTVGYMAPEQIRGLRADLRSDVFVFGIVFYEMLAGSAPFERQSAADTMAAILTENPIRIPQLDSEVARLIDRCLRKEAAERFQSATEIKAALEASAATRSDMQPSVAVFPFANMTGAKEDDYFCEGIAEEIINDLTRIPGLRVIARTSAFAVGRMELDVREAGARLGVNGILEGSVRREGRRVRVTAQLVNTTDGSHLWSERYDRELTDILALEEEIAAAIAAKLRVEMGGGSRQPKKPASSPEAHAAFLEGRYYFARATPQALAQAKTCYELAISRDPDFALACDSLAELLWYLGFFGNMPPLEAFSLSTWHAMRALELDDTLGETHALLGMLRKELDYNWEEVDREMRRAIQLCPESPLVRLRNAISSLLPHGRVDEGMNEIARLLQTDPLSILLRWWLAMVAYLARKPNRTIEEGRHMIALDPTHFLGHYALGIGMEEIGEFSEAAPCFEKALELSGGMPLVLGFLSHCYGRAGRHDDARRLLERGKKLATERYVPPSSLAMGFIGLGDWDSAFLWLDQAVEARDPIIMAIRTFPFLDPVRDDARYRALLRKMRLG